VAFKIRQNAFQAGALPGPHWGSSQRSTDTLVGLGGDTTPPHTALHSAPQFERALSPIFSSKIASDCYYYVVTKVVNFPEI